MSESIFEPLGDGRFVPTDAALGPWSEHALHGGPPAMLLAREIERHHSEHPTEVSRLTIELLRPIGKVPLEARARVIRPGRKVQLVEAALWHGEQEVARATALRIRHAEVEVPVEPESLPHPEPESLLSWTSNWRPAPAYHMLGVEIRVDPGWVAPLAPQWAWFRLKLPLVPGEQPSGLVRICAAADFPNGISYVVDPRQMSFVNPDLTIHVRRAPVDEWVMVDAKTWLEPDGRGMAEGALYDRRGRVGRSVQSLIVERRG